MPESFVPTIQICRIDKPISQALVKESEPAATILLIRGDRIDKGEELALGPNIKTVHCDLDGKRLHMTLRR